jgi:hypothetical protein
LLESAASNRHHRSAHARYQLTVVQIQALLQSRKLHTSPTIKEAKEQDKARKNVPDRTAGTKKKNGKRIAQPQD